jgi:hypothetical protein
LLTTADRGGGLYRRLIANFRSFLFGYGCGHPLSSKVYGDVIFCLRDVVHCTPDGVSGLIAPGQPEVDEIQRTLARR